MLSTVGVDKLCDVGSDVVTEDEVYGYCLARSVSAGFLLTSGVHSYCCSDEQTGHNVLGHSPIFGHLDNGVSPRRAREGKGWVGARSVASKIWGFFGRRGRARRNRGLGCT